MDNLLTFSPLTNVPSPRFKKGPSHNKKILFVILIFYQDINPRLAAMDVTQIPMIPIGQIQRIKKE